jgi:hypothetical protein
MTSSPMSTTENNVTKIVGEIRKRKGMKVELPPLDEYKDKL